MLKRIKLAGFKSFADPTSIPFQYQLTAIVGPNGCGKSNIIDAVRWVLGEISAKEMRGELMSDVIFNGSTSRKSLGRASVELTIDNSSARIGGLYGGYHEIEVRREVDRELGTSDYYLNGARCRRKDIADLFLDTGYTIIGQNAVLGIVDAKPEELRANYFEEAAGISKFKKRRYETEERIKRTKENLLRLNDIRNEIENQLKILKRQSNAATIYKKLREKERLIKAEIHTLDWQRIRHDIQEKEQAIKVAEVDLAEKLSNQRQIEAVLEELHQKQTGLNDEYDAAQNAFYRFSASVSQFEQKIYYNKERKIELSNDLTKLDQNLAETNQHKDTDTLQIKSLEDEYLKLEPEILESHSALKEAEIFLQKAETMLHEWQLTWDEFNSKAANTAQAAEVEHTKLQHLKEVLEMKSVALTKLEQEAQDLNFVNLDQEIANLNTTNNDFTIQTKELEGKLLSLQNEIGDERIKGHNLMTELNQAQSNLQTLLGKESALHALQNDSLGGNKGEIKDWLEKNNLFNKSRLVKELKVDSGWERAVEAVLGDYLEAICIDDLEQALTNLSTLQKITGNAITFHVKSNPGSEVKATKMVTLASKIHPTQLADQLASSVYIADSLEEALKARANLAQNESIVTRDGIWLSANWLRLSLQAGSKGSVLEREKELQKIVAEITRNKKLVEELEAKHKNQQEKLISKDVQQESLRQKLHALTNQKSEINSALSAKQMSLIHVKERIQNLQCEITANKSALHDAENQITIVEKSWQNIVQQKEQDEAERLRLLEKRDQYREKFNIAREEETKKKEAVTNLEKRRELLKKQSDYLGQSLKRAEQQLANISQRHLELEKALLEVTEPIEAMTKELEEMLAKRLALEKELLIKKTAVSEIDNKLRDSEKERALHQEGVEGIRSQLEMLRILKQGLEVEGNNHIAQITELELNLENVLEEITKDQAEGQVNHEILSDKLSKASKRIERLGPINLAAIDEYNQQNERKNYLDAQNDDLLKALSTLDDAICKIDNEAKAKLQMTFDKINLNFQDLFPKVFRGGKASLQMVGDNILESGIQILAQPPGKRNSSIHLLSGGEKALTAMALIFSIFQINPAPFCLLDEVDAPFDDENIGRFCQLVKDMSNNVQFIYVSHNKISMEIASHLLGVTMQEPGVSRIVSVDIDQAMNMAKVE